MSKIAAHFVALEFLKSKGTATPAEIEAHVGKGKYAAKYVCYLKLHGYEIETVKSGKTVVEYKFISDGDSATRDFKWVPPAQRGKAAAPKTAKPKTAKAAKPKAEKPVKVRQSKQTPVKKAARTVLKDKADKQADALLAELGMRNAGEYAGGTYSVDPDWDSMDGIDVANFLK